VDPRASTSENTFWATVDADFEALQPQFLPRMMEMLRSDSSLAGVSTDYSPTNDNYFDTYSKENQFIHYSGFSKNKSVTRKNVAL
jgi:hypothetical protein